MWLRLYNGHFRIIHCFKVVSKYYETKTNSTPLAFSIVSLLIREDQCILI